MMATATTPATLPPMIPTSVLVLMALEALGTEVCMVPSWGEEVVEAVVVTDATVEDEGGGVVVEGVDVVLEDKEVEDVVVEVEVVLTLVLEVVLVVVLVVEPLVEVVVVVVDVLEGERNIVLPA